MTQPIHQQHFSLFSRFWIALAASLMFVCTAWADDSAAIADLKAKLAAVERDVEQLTSSENKVSTDMGIPLHGFADVGYTHASNDQTRLNQAGKGFWANSLDFYLTPQFGDRAKGLVELIFEFAPDGGLATDLERIQLGYTLNDQMTLWMGRFHAPYGYWNTAFHHGAQIQTSILRPRFIDFEDKGGLLPAHVMGAWATGGMHLGEGKLNYDFYAGNGNAINVDTTSSPRGSLDINNARDSNSNTLVGTNLSYKTGGLVVGAHSFVERINIQDANPATLLPEEVSVSMTGLYSAYENDDWESIAEYYRFNNKDLTGSKATHASWLAFAQLGHALGNDWMPYLRLEKGVLDQADAYFSRQEYGVSYVRQALGVRYSLNAKAALKLEVNRTKEGDGVPESGADNGNYKEARVQYSIRF